MQVLVELCVCETRMQVVVHMVWRIVEEVHLSANKGKMIMYVYNGDLVVAHKEFNGDEDRNNASWH